MNVLILSYGGDTNGGNARTVNASRKFGNDKAVLRALAIGNQDPAGVVGRFQAAAEKGDALTIRSAHRTTSYLNFPSDIIWSAKTEPQIRTLAAQADVIHLNNSEMAAKRLRLRGPMLLHHHGTLFRSNPERMLALAKQNRWVQGVSTIDLQQPDPKVLHWLPSPYDIDELQAFRQGKREPDGRIRIGHFPTNKATKHTDLFLQAVKELQEEGLPIDLVMSPIGSGSVNGWTWAETMEQKATIDILYDQLAYGYGCNSIEAWGMGIPVIAGADDWTLARMAAEWPAIPFEEATEKTLKDVIQRMVVSADLREDAAERGMSHVRKYHDEKPALERLAELYAKAISLQHTTRIPGKAVTFRSKTGKSLEYDGQPITFDQGTHSTSDPYVITHLRTLSRRSTFGIEEVA